MKQIDPNKEVADKYTKIKRTSKTHRLESIQGLLFDALFCVQSGIDETPPLQEVIREIKKYMSKKHDLK